MFVCSIMRRLMSVVGISPAIYSLLFSLCAVTSVFAQPTQQTPPDLTQLQQQLAAIHAQIDSLNQQKYEADQSEDARVKSVGSQRIRRSFESDVEDSLHIRLYDLSDIFAVSPHYPAEMPNDLDLSSAMFESRSGPMIGGGGLGGGGAGGVFRVPPSPSMAPNPEPRQEADTINMRAAQVSMQQLVTTIQQTVEPEKWGKGRDQSKVEFLGNTLLITATEDMHNQINNLLNLFREHWGKLRTISVQTYWIRAGAAEAASLLDQESNDAIGAGIVSQEKWQPFLESAKTENRFAYSATLTGHNNQTLSALSGRQRQLTLDAIPFETTKASMWFEHPDEIDAFGDDSGDDEDLNLFSRTRQVVGFKPVRQSFHEGAAIQVTPLATRGGNFVILDLHAKVNQLIVPKENNSPSVFVQTDQGLKSEVVLDQADYVAYRLNTTLRCPKEQVVLAGGMTYDPTANEEQPNLYLFVKVSVHTIKEDKSDWTATDTEPKN